MVQTLLVALSLSMDALAVSVSAAACSAALKPGTMFRAAFTFGFFQFAMPMLGWFGSSFFIKYASVFDHWLAFFLLAFVGGKTIFQTLSEMREEKKAAVFHDGSDDDVKEMTSSCQVASGLESMKNLFALAVATSIDALTIGIVYASMNEPIFIPSLIIGLVTFVVCSFGFFAGKKAGAFFGKYAQLAGGFVLVLLGVRILISHLLAE